MALAAIALRYLVITSYFVHLITSKSGELGSSNAVVI